MEGDHKAFDEISKKLLAQHPAFSQRLEVMHTLIRGDVEKARQLISDMPFLDFNLAISSGMFEEVLERANRNIPKGQLRDLSFTHGWLLPETYIFPVYTHNLSTFKSKPEVITLLKNTGQFSYWREQNRWPDYCEFERYKSHRPSFCDERL